MFYIAYVLAGVAPAKGGTSRRFHLRLSVNFGLSLMFNADAQLPSKSICYLFAMGEQTRLVRNVRRSLS